jgi:hypothetical protein
MPSSALAVDPIRSNHPVAAIIFNRLLNRRASQQEAIGIKGMIIVVVVEGISHMMP